MRGCVALGIVRMDSLARILGRGLTLALHTRILSVGELRGWFAERRCALPVWQPEN